MLTPLSKATDFLCIAGAAYVSQHLVFQEGLAFSYIDGLLGLLGLTLPFVTFQLTRVYQPYRNDSVIVSAIRTLAAWFAAQSILAIVSHVYPGTATRNHWLLWWTVIAACALVVGRYSIHALPLLFRSWWFAPPRIAIVAPSGGNGNLIDRITAQTRDAFVPELIFDPSLAHDTNVERIPAICELQSFIQSVRAKSLREIWILNSPFQPIPVKSLLEEFKHEFVNIRVLPVIDEQATIKPRAGDYRGVRVFNLKASPERGWSVVPKEIFDRIFALCMLLSLSPLLLVIALAVKCSSPGPVLFRQYRKGMNGEVFSIYKFRTMYQGNGSTGTVVQAKRDDTRVTRAGRFLRRTSLDELPQFLNVLNGEMSVVGPRPHAVEHDEYYKDLVQDYMFRYRIKPGITGLAQINGYRGETAQLEKMEGRVRLDTYYIQNWSFWMDIKIITLTIIRGFSGHGAY
ncbi:undecaprenyl-phosphate glucose phosphotransferase [Paraburkholderia sp. LEh10]|uniref:undecaprenyl-phosphate glucose phosphotransferase n=1 Tax=Paraburkholderia sp. LEh10 TaxID=2821353 RepID=UPI001AEAFEE4|nr:undecaprenyl-phosphate glucose phosphotransferase [Paraburkholderia sp. LEh10]MBP0592511.1 undecaprenyl-phosphate glucose phosphotransferase [Paraburkholderia sp. LEh10]